MSNDVSDWKDERESQATLDIGEASLRTQDRDAKVAEGSDEFTDDRPDKSDGGEQAQLFPDCDENQATLTGESAAGNCLFED